MNATHAVDIQEIQTTRGEKVLAVVLGIFLVVGLSWGYQRLDVREPYDPLATVSPADQAAIDALSAAESELAAAQAELEAAFSEMEVRRERYRTALDAGRRAEALAAQYRQSERMLTLAQQRVGAAQTKVAELTPAAEVASERRSEAAAAEQRRGEQLTFLFRLLLALGALGAAFGLLRLLRGSRYFMLGLAAVGAATVLTFVFSTDYVEDHVEWRDTGPVVLSAAGIALTLASFWGLQRYLRRRIPLRRVRKGECPFCGFPAAGNSSCEGCGRAVAGSCAHCGSRRRVGVLYCGSCGKA